MISRNRILIFTNRIGIEDRRSVLSRSPDWQVFNFYLAISDNLIRIFTCIRCFHECCIILIGVGNLIQGKGDHRGCVADRTAVCIHPLLLYFDAGGFQIIRKRSKVSRCQRVSSNIEHHRFCDKIDSVLVGSSCLSNGIAAGHQIAQFFTGCLALTDCQRYCLTVAVRPGN